MQRAKALANLGDHRKQLEEMGVRELYLFGSVARDEARLSSDVDVLVELARPMGFEFFALKPTLENFLGCKVDVGTPDSLKPALRERVMQEAIRVF
jgi:uncharacterized protein